MDSVNLEYFPGGSDGKASAYNAGDPGSIPGSRKSYGEGNGYPLQYSYLENSMVSGLQSVGSQRLDTTNSIIFCLEVSVRYTVITRHSDLFVIRKK